MRSRFLDDFVARAERARLNLHGVMVVQSAAILGEHHWIHDTPHELRSISKSFASCAVGIAIDEGARSPSTTGSSTSSRPTSTSAPTTGSASSPSATS